MVFAPNQLPLIDRDDYHLLQQLREREPSQSSPQIRLTLGQRLSDGVAAIVGSWRFITIQSGILVIWIALNVTAFIQHWDPYPFILLNLALSFQAAYTAPIIMMSQNRQAEIDRQNAKHDYEINMKAELEIELLHDKFDRLESFCTQEFDAIKAMQQEQLSRLEAIITKQANISSTGV
ncbi:DUF1003 domain-containing protein [Aerosakkonemataceae cyanobacterium BLCC-F50]|uniref:DUF1003 domain-containing protein n=1 Tax=Floridaenema flaviceps BLCC-F50 TaxID=3153642 RepID=A0ABV4Y0X4_9CYAN